MPISEIGTYSRRTNSGFSLLELMVVVAIIGIFAGTLTLSLRSLGDDRGLEREALRLEGLLGLLREEALMQNRDYGIVFSETGYRFYVYDYVAGAWVPPPNERIFVDYRVPEAIEIELSLEERDVDLDHQFAQQIDEDAEPEPQVLVFATGEITPFDLGVYRDFSGGRYRLVADIDGELSVAANGFEWQR